jgi:redox-sensitive bicupin YhaK (pirin superfamily)
VKILAYNSGSSRLKFCADAPSNALTLVCTPDGVNKSIKINQDVNLFIGKLAAKGKIIHSMCEQRHARVQLIEGDLDLNGKKLSPGDGASLDDEKEIRFEPTKGAHFLLFDLN